MENEKQRANVLDSLIIEEIKKRENNEDESPRVPPPEPVSDVDITIDEPKKPKIEDNIVDLNESNVGYSWGKPEKT